MLHGCGYASLDDSIMICSSTMVLICHRRVPTSIPGSPSTVHLTSRRELELLTFSSGAPPSSAWARRSLRRDYD